MTYRLALFPGILFCIYDANSFPSLAHIKRTHNGRPGLSIYLLPRFTS